MDGENEGEEDKEADREDLEQGLSRILIITLLSF